MVAETRDSILVDPLSAYWGLALFPRTLGIEPDTSKRCDPEADLDAIHSHLKSLALQSPNKLLEEAKMVLDGGSELANSEIVQYLANKEKKVDAIKDKESLQERRPALGRKRARFSLKPNIIQPAASLEPSLDIEQLKDPEEFFLAYERLENAKRELQKQIGGASMDFNQHNPSKTTRQRRPGMLGRSVRYRHRYSSVTSEDNENVLSSQETLDSIIVSPPNDISQFKTNQDLASRERELAGSMENPENTISKILDELLSGNVEDLEGNGAVSILQKQLQIKPINLEKLNLPELRDIPKIDLNSSRKSIRKPRKALADIDNILEGISSKSPVKLILESETSIHHIASPTPPRNPFASSALLRRQILQAKPSNDPFSSADVDHSQEKISSPVQCMLKEFDLGHTVMQLSKDGVLKSPLIEKDDIATAKTGSPDVAVADFNSVFEEIVCASTGKPSFGVDFGPSGTSVDIDDNFGVNIMGNEAINEQLSRQDTDIDARENGSSKLQEKVYVGDLTCPHEAVMHDASISLGIDVGLSGTHGNMEDNVGGRNMGSETTDEQLSRQDADISMLANGSNKPEDEVDTIQEIVRASTGKPSFGDDVGPSGSLVDIDDNVGANIMGNEAIDEQLSRQDTDIGAWENGSSKLREKVYVGDLTCPHEAIMHDASISLGIDVGLSGTHGNMEDNVGGCNMDGGATDEQLSRQDVDINTLANGSKKPDDEVEDMLPEAVEAVASPECNVNAMGENSNRIQTSFGQSSSSVVEDHAVDVLSEALDSVPTQHESTEVPLNQQNEPKTRLPKKRKGKECANRKSLAGAGLSWEDGVRRSTRIRTRPLQYWKGERLIYGRIHQSLTTVIGMKYFSPTKGDGEPTLKVKSFVSDDHKELVELASLY